jgi:nitroimidazol reductase NimA-like FMN-containing flavoprotein (pyridoxamine 5'-phosphate oxidase superfamily)
MSLKMSKSEREAFLADLHVGVISIAEEGRGPLAAPIWYDYEPGGDLQILTERNSRKAPLLKAAMRFSLVAQTETPPYKYVSVEGPVTAIEEPDLERDERSMAHRYLGQEFGDRYIESTRTGGGEGSILVKMRPQRWLTTDYSKTDSSE